MKRKVFCFMAFTLSFVIGSCVLLYWNSFKTDELSDLKSARSETWKRVLSFENKELLELTGEQQIKLFKDFYELVDKDVYVGFGNSIRFTKFANERNQIRYVLIGGNDYVSENLSRKLSFQIFDKDGNHLNSREIETKQPFSLNAVTIRSLPGFGRDTIEVTCKPEFPEDYAELENYALIGDDIQLIESAQVIE